MMRVSSSTRILIFAVAAFLGCQSAKAEPAPPDASPLEKLLAAKSTRTGLAVTVQTGGCTKKSDFEITSHRLRKNRASVEIRRTTPDNCKGNFPEGLKLTFSWKELKLPKWIRVSVKNPIEKSRKHTGQSPR